ncbi:hypothetical protein KUCAC02_006599 [Chaenocephalus aceratus]|uniref:Uncharacterized protein n=1 Tax=Chaenocephalus aceratus TaxID=36190 RepID=A0ACB9VSU2_CHAAC|nr:hypothetical protein KUCAC02_006599 [Chaenocephalus aceratus]
MADKDLMWALKTGDMDEVESKLVTAEDGAEVNAPDKHGLTPLISACYEGHASCVKVLLEKGADKDRKGPDGISAFEAAEDEAIKALLK